MLKDWVLCGVRGFLMGFQGFSRRGLDSLDFLEGGEPPLGLLLDESHASAALSTRETLA